MIYLKDAESYGVIQAAKDKETLGELGIKSPDITKMYKLKINKDTFMYFRSKERRAKFIQNRYNRENKTFNKKGLEISNSDLLK